MKKSRTRFLSLMFAASLLGIPAAAHHHHHDQGGRQFASEDDPDWKNMKAWVMGEKAGSSSTQ